MDRSSLFSSELKVQAFLIPAKAALPSAGGGLRIRAGGEPVVDAYPLR